jgi:hypothetical protein
MALRPPLQSLIVIIPAVSCHSCSTSMVLGDESKARDVMRCDARGVLIPNNIFTSMETISAESFWDAGQY